MGAVVSERVEIIEAIDWYDGLVLGAIRLPSLPGLQLAGLVAWSQDRGVRAYLAVPTTPDAVQELRRLDWDALQARAGITFRAHATAHVLVVHDDANHALVAAPQLINVSDLFAEAAPIKFDAERALNEDPERWVRKPTTEAPPEDGGSSD
jgi:hypothetical protein